MMVKALILFCAQALMIQSIAGYCTGSRLAAAPLAEFTAPCAGSLAYAGTFGSPYNDGPFGLADGLYGLADGPYGLASGTYGLATGPYGLASGTYGLASGTYGLAAGPYGPAAAAASNGGALPTSSASAFAPSGVSLISENVYEGPLSVAGALPFLGTVALEGALPTAGAGTVAFGAGNGEVAMLREDSAAACGAAPYAFDGLGYRAGAFGYGMGAPGFGAPLAGPYARAGCGCGLFK